MNVEITLLESSFHLLLIRLSRHFLEKTKFDSLNLQNWSWNTWLASRPQGIIRGTLEPGGRWLYFATPVCGQVPWVRPNAGGSRARGRRLGATLILHLGMGLTSIQLLRGLRDMWRLRELWYFWIDWAMAIGAVQSFWKLRSLNMSHLGTRALWLTCIRKVWQILSILEA